MTQKILLNVKWFSCKLRDFSLRGSTCTRSYMYNRVDLEEYEEEDSHGQGSRLSNSTPTEAGPEIVTMPSRFERVQENGNIDVWWLYDDGGEVILTTRRRK